MTKENIIFTHSFKSDIGTIRIASTLIGLAYLTLPGESEKDFKKSLKKNFPDFEFRQGGSFNKEIESQIKKYLDGRLKKFKVKLDWQTTPFREKALKQIAKIPYGIEIRIADQFRINHPSQMLKSDNLISGSSENMCKHGVSEI